MLRWQREVWGVIFTSLVAVGCVADARAGSMSEVRFDIPQFVACRDVSPESTLRPNSGQRRLVETRLSITALPAAGQARSRLQYTYRVMHPTGSLEFVDYQPRTGQETTVAGNIAVEETRERQQTAGLSLSGTFQQFVQGSLHGDAGQKETAHVRYELKPPRDVTLVSGTLQRGSGVYFTLLPSADAVWEGSHEFAVVLSVPREWRGDVLYVRCEAHEVHAGNVVSRGTSRFAVGLYAEGDDEAREVAEQYHGAEKALRRAVALQQRAIESEAVPTVVHRVGAWLDVYQPRIPAGWLDRLVYGPPQLAEYDFVDHLPQEVRQAAERFVHAKQRLQELSVGRSRLARANRPLALDTR
jgi:hypothetical protein